MSSTVSTEKCATAFRASDGNVVYALFEKTYESNVHPHEPRWSCIAVGAFESVLASIFRSAAACEGGMLRGPRGTLRPETYARAWINALQQPFRLAARTVALQVSSRFSATVPEGRRLAVDARLRAAGRHDIADRLAAGETYELDTSRESTELIALYGGSPALMAPWRAIDWRGIGDADAGLAPPARTLSTSAPRVTVHRIGGSFTAFSIDGGPVRPNGWMYSLVEHLVATIAPALEAQHTGSGFAFMRRMRAAIDAAQPVPAGTTCVVRRPQGNDDHSCWMHERFERLHRVRATDTDGHGDVLRLTVEQALESQVLDTSWRDFVELLLPAEASLWTASVEAVTA